MHYLLFYLLSFLKNNIMKNVLVAMLLMATWVSSASAGKVLKLGTQVTGDPATLAAEGTRFALVQDATSSDPKIIVFTPRCHGWYNQSTCSTLAMATDTLNAYAKDQYGYEFSLEAISDTSDTTANGNYYLRVHQNNPTQDVAYYYGAGYFNECGGWTTNSDQNKGDNKVYGSCDNYSAVWIVTKHEDDTYSFKSAESGRGYLTYIPRTDDGEKPDQNPALANKQEDERWQLYTVTFAEEAKPVATGYKALDLADMTADATGTTVGWDFATPQDWTGYQYLVVVPKTQYEDGNSINQMQYELSDGTHTAKGWTFAWGTYQRRRVAVIDIKNKIIPKSNTDNEKLNGVDLSELNFSSVHSFKAVMEGTTDNPTFAFSAVYLTNTPPTFNNEQWGGDQIAADYVRPTSAKDTYGTLCLPYDAAVCGVDVYEPTGVDNTDNPKTLYLKPVTGVLTAGKSYIFKTLADNSYQADGTTVAQKLAYLSAYKAGEGSTQETSTVNGLVGNLTAKTVSVPKDNYILVGGKWKKVVATTNTIGANRAYLDLSRLTPTTAKGNIAMSLGDGAATGITELKAGEATSHVFYNLNGQRVPANYKGIVIVNGKKYINR